MKRLHQVSLTMLLSCLCIFGMSSKILATTTDNNNYDHYIKPFCLNLEKLKSDNIQIPEDVFNNAKGVLVLNNFKASFVIGNNHTKGIGFKKLQDSFGPIAFYKCPGFSVGLQLGASSNYIVMMLMNDEGLKLLQGQNAQLSGDLKIAAGPKSFNASTKDNADVYVYSTGKGIELGASLGIEQINIDHTKIKRYYNIKDDDNANKDNDKITIDKLLNNEYKNINNPNPEQIQDFFNKLEALKSNNSENITQQTE